MKTILCFLSMMTLSPFSLSYAGDVMPVPASVRSGNGYLRIDGTFSMRLIGNRDQRTDAAVMRFLQRVYSITGMPVPFREADDRTPATLELQWKAPFGNVPQLRQDESYALRIQQDEAFLSASSFVGILRGLETFLQLIETGPEGFRVPFTAIDDAPRFPWRGLLIDACRHWMPVNVIKRNLDCMALVKMNVLHWHLSEDQGFRVESKKFPKLHGMGSDGMFYTQEQVRDIVAYAADRGIRIVPEFDMPGHTTSWFVGYPDLASAPGPYQIERKWGIFDPAMDPSRESTFRFLDEFLGEMAALFPDEYIHIGGDEVNGKQWNANEQIQQFKDRKGLKDNHELQAYFNQRVADILKKHGKKMIGWDEILGPDVPGGTVIQSWRGQKSLTDAVKKGLSGILSYGYYLDHLRPASFHYANDPIDSSAASLSAEERSRILGGEACMWAEFVTPENIDSRIWPRAAAIAERLWSPASVQDVDDMYQRLGKMEKWLTLAGSTHRDHYRRMMERLAGDHAPEPLLVLAAALKPMGLHERQEVRQYTSQTPLNRLVDAARPESDEARLFGQLLVQARQAKISTTDRLRLDEMITRWRENHSKLEPLMSGNFLLNDIGPLSRDLSDVAVIAAKLLEVSANGEKLSEGQIKLFDSVLTRAEPPKADVKLMVVPPVKQFFEEVAK